MVKLRMAKNMSSYCHECGKRLDKDDDFCPSCGKNVKEDSKSMKLKKKHILLISIVVVVVIFSVLGLPYLLNSTKIGNVFNKQNQNNSVSKDLAATSKQNYSNEVNNLSSIYSTASTGENGITITDFSSSASDASGCNKAMRINIAVENQGGNSIGSGNLLACIIGKNFPGTTKEQMWAIDTSSTQCQSLKKVLGDSNNNTSGGAASFKWTVYSPFVPFPLTRTDGFTGRVFYKYSSRTSAIVAIIPKNGQVSPSALQIDKSISPVDISIGVNQPIIGDSGDTFTLKVTLSNVGGGIVFDPSTINFANDASTQPSIPDDSLNIISIAVNTSLDAGISSGFCAVDLNNVELRNGSSVTIPCDIRINRQITGLQYFSITFTTNYGYFIDSNEIPINVSGVKGKDASSCSA